MGKGAVNMHGFAAGTEERRAHAPCVSLESSLRVGTVLRLAAGEPVRADRTFAHPTIFWSRYSLPDTRTRLGASRSRQSKRGGAPSPAGPSPASAVAGCAVDVEALRSLLRMAG